MPIHCPVSWKIYSSIRKLWEEALKITNDTEMKARIQGVVSQTVTFVFFFGLVLSEKIVHHTDALSRALPKPKLPSAEGQEIARLTVTLKSALSLYLMTSGC